MIATLAKMLGLTTEHAEASIHSERAARAVLTRRNLFAAGAAMAARSAFSFGAAEPAGFWIQNEDVYDFDFVEVRINGHRLPGLVSFTYSLDRGRSFSAPKPLPPSGTIALPGTGCTMTFTALLQPQQTLLRRTWRA